MVIKKNHGSEHIPAWKVNKVKELIQLIKSYKVVGILSFEGILGSQFQKMRKELHNIAILKVTRNTIIEKSLSEPSLNSNISKLKNYISSQTGLVFTNENPFKLYSLLEKTKTKSPIKAGSISPCDILVEKGPTSFPPGPILGELQSSGIPVSVESGKIVVKENKIVCKAGEKVSQKLATSLSKLEIYPLEVGLNLYAAFDSGTIFLSDELNINIDNYINNIIECSQSAYNLSINASYPTNETIADILYNCNLKSLNLGINCNICNSKTINIIISKSFNEMLCLSSILYKNNDNSISDQLKNILCSNINENNSTIKEDNKSKEINNKSESNDSSDHSEEDGMAGLGALFG